MQWCVVCKKPRQPQVNQKCEFPHRISHGDRQDAGVETLFPSDRGIVWLLWIQRVSSLKLVSGYNLSDTPLNLTSCRLAQWSAFSWNRCKQTMNDLGDCPAPGLGPSTSSSSGGLSNTLSMVSLSSPDMNPTESFPSSLPSGMLIIRRLDHLDLFSRSSVWSRRD